MVSVQNNVLYNEDSIVTAYIGLVPAAEKLDRKSRDFTARLGINVLTRHVSSHTPVLIAEFNACWHYLGSRKTAEGMQPYTLQYTLINFNL